MMGKVQGDSRRRPGYFTVNGSSWGNGKGGAKGRNFLENGSLIWEDTKIGKTGGITKNTANKRQTPKVHSYVVWGGPAAKGG